MSHIVAGKYRVLDLLGEGGMGSVYEAQRLDDGARVALKLVSHKHSDEISLARFDREARLAASVASEHVVGVYDTGTDSRTGLPYIAMEMLEGEELEHVLDAVGTLPVDVALSIVAQALTGLAQAHEAGIVHRDIKAANIFMHKIGDGKRTVKILDFGIAKRGAHGGMTEEEKGLTRTGTMLGSPLYMSPEQARGHKTVDERTDVWSMGLVLYRMLTGIFPNEDVDVLGELILRITSEPAKPVQMLAPWVQPDVADIVERALEIEKEARFTNAAEMLAAVTAVIGDGWTITDEDLEPIRSVAKAQVAEPSKRRLADEASFADTHVDPPVRRRVAEESGTRTDDTYSAVTGEKPPSVERTRMFLTIGIAATVTVAAGIAIATTTEQLLPIARLDTVHDIAREHALAVPAPAPPPPPPPTPAPVAEPSKNVRLTVEAKPAAVEVYLDDQKLGSTEGELELPRGDQPVTLVLKKSGYRDHEVRVVPKADVVISAALQRVHRVVRPGPAGHPDLESPL